MSSSFRVAGCAAVIGAVVLVVGAGTAWAPATPGGTVDLLTQANIEIDGAAANEETAFSVAGAGDVNGDGRPDVIMGAPGEFGGGSKGGAYVVFGRATNATVDLANLGSAGFAIRGATADGLAGWSVAGVGDMNGDGKADVAVGAWQEQQRGIVYVVFGKATSTPVDLASLGSGGFEILGAPKDSAGFQHELGTSLDGAGDVNGDGVPDLIAGDGNGVAGLNGAYVVFGKASTTAVDTGALASQGFKLNPDASLTDDNSIDDVAGVGDVNGDGKADVAVSSHNFVDGSPLKKGVD